MKKLILIFLVSFFVSCISEDVDFRGIGDTEINIYLVEDGQLGYFTSEVNFDTISLEPTPWLKNSEIEFYDWSAHIFYLNTKKEKGKYAGRHFVVKEEFRNSLQNENLFIGMFFSMYMSSIPQIPSILATDDFFTPADVVSFGHFGSYLPGNLDNQTEFKEALLSSGLFHEGIQVEMLKIDRKSSSTLSYTIRVTNNDTRNIYVLDPNKMGAGRFHYYTNGVSLRKDNVSYYSQDESISSSEIKGSWYYNLAPQKSMVRTITLDGYSNLPTGEVHFHFSFPGSNVDAGEWKKSDGRIWLGNKFIEGDVKLN